MLPTIADNSIRVVQSSSANSFCVYVRLSTDPSYNAQI